MFVAHHDGMIMGGQGSQMHYLPIINKIRSWLDDVLPQIAPSSATGGALSYLNNEWKHLIRYLDDGRLEIDNNGAENAIRPFVMGRNYPQFVVMEG